MACLRALFMLLEPSEDGWVSLENFRKISIFFILLKAKCFSYAGVSGLSSLTCSLGWSLISLLPVVPFLCILSLMSCGTYSQGNLKKKMKNPQKKGNTSAFVVHCFLLRGWYSILAVFCLKSKVIYVADDATWIAGCCPKMLLMIWWCLRSQIFYTWSAYTVLTPFL